MMQVRYNLTWLGWWTAAQHGCAVIRREIGYRWLFFILNVTLWMFVGFWFMAALDVMERKEQRLAELGLVVAPLLAAGVLLVTKALYSRMQQSIIRKRVPPQEFTVRIEDDGLHFDGRESQHIPWDSVGGVVRLPAHLAIETTTFSVATIPLDAFASPSHLDEFAAAIRERAPRLRAGA